MVEGLAAARVTVWWEHKLAPIMGTGYAAASFTGASVIDTAGSLALVLLGVAAAAAYVCLLNDLTDREADRLAGKPNRLAGHPPAVWWTFLAIVIAAGTALAAAAWRGDVVLLVLYAGIWAAFGLYSVPPVRLKVRGAAGVIADAAGAHLFPHLLVVAVVLADGGRTLDAPFATAVGAWALANGLRGSLWHQIGDLEADERAGVRTFALADPERARRLGAYVLFPVELLAFSGLLALSHGVLAVLLVSPYLLLELRRTRRWGIALVVVGSARDYRIVLHEYYIALYPLAFLVQATLRDPRAAIVLAIHLLLFPATVARVAHDTCRELRRLQLAAVAR